MSSPLVRSLLAASLCLAPLGWAAAQDQPPQDQQHQRDHQEHPQQPQHDQPQQQQHAPQQQHTQQPQHTQQQPHGNAAPQGQHTGGSPGGGQGGEHQRPAQNNPAPQQHAGQSGAAQTNAATPAPPTGATASPTPPSAQGQPQHGQRPAQNNATAPQSPQQHQPFQQRGAAAPVGAAAPQAQQPAARGNVQTNNHSGSTVTFTQHHSGYAQTQFDHGHFYGHDYAHFTPHDRDLWYRGGWHHEFHDGRMGWWYAVDGIWYFFDQPIYPYPTYIPDVVYIPEDDAPPPDYVDAPSAPAPAPPQYGQPATYYYYFCRDTQTYYPYVATCASAWQPVPAAPQ